MSDDAAPQSHEPRPTKGAAPSLRPQRIGGSPRMTLARGPLFTHCLAFAALMASQAVYHSPLPGADYFANAYLALFVLALIWRVLHGLWQMGRRAAALLVLQATVFAIVAEHFLG